MKLKLVKLETDKRRILYEDLSRMGTLYEEAVVYRKDMERICKRNNGIGLAANQAGLRLNMFLAMPDAKLRSYAAEIVVQPRWKPDPDAKQFVHYEGCLSLEKGRLYPVNRWTAIHAEWLGRDGLVSCRLVGMAAMVFQHESDHLKGRLLVDAKP